LILQNFIPRSTHDIDTINDENLAYLLEHNVAVTPGEPFGLENSFRICYACSRKDLEDGLNIIKQALKEI
jgi:aspartate/methionine/tyrosine aminotransferase